MSLGVVAALTEDQIKEIILAKRALPIATSSATAFKARQILAQFHPGWGSTLNEYENAAIRQLHKARNGRPYDTLDAVTFFRAVESFATGLIAQEHLTLDEYNLLIGPVCTIAAPELMLDKQNWTTKELPKYAEAEVVTNFKEQVAKTESRFRRRPKEKVEEEEEVVEDNLAAVLKALAKTSKPPAKPQERPQEKPDTKKTVESVVARFSKHRESKVEEGNKDVGDVALEEGVTIHKEEDGYFLESAKTHEFISGGFETKLKAISYVMRNKWKIV